MSKRMEPSWHPEGYFDPLSSYGFLSRLAECLELVCEDWKVGWPGEGKRPWIYQAKVYKWVQSQWPRWRKMSRHRERESRPDRQDDLRDHLSADGEIQLLHSIVCLWGRFDKMDPIKCLLDHSDGMDISPLFHIDCLYLFCRILNKSIARPSSKFLETGGGCFFQAPSPLLGKGRLPEQRRLSETLCGSPNDSKGSIRETRWDRTSGILYLCLRGQRLTRHEKNQSTRFPRERKRKRVSPCLIP